MIIDIHCHIHEFDEEELKASLNQAENIVIVGVGDDLESSKKVIELSKNYNQIAPCIGLHPWSVKRKESIKEALLIVKLALKNNIKCLGEVGLDTKFVPQTIELQREVFKVFLEAARDHDMFLNLHTAGTWEEVFNLLVRYDIGAANFHWYTGPRTLLKDIEAHGYTISINPAVKIQKKHQEIVRVAPIEIMLTESDSPYEYRGLRLTPLMISETLRIIANIKALGVEETAKSIWDNFVKKYLKYFDNWLKL